MARVSDLFPLLASFVPDPSVAAEESYRRTLGLLRMAEAPLDRRRYDPGHLTASAVILDPDGGSVLVLWHERLARWLQPGGHFEAEDADAMMVARREVLEETGVPLAGLTGRLVGVDVHRIPAARGEPAHWHHDLVFAFRLPERPSAAVGEARWEWCAIESLPLKGADDALRRAVARARVELAYLM